MPNNSRKSEVGIASNDDQLLLNVLSLEIEYNKQLRAEFGQRIFGPKDGDVIIRPCKGSEVYVGHLPKDAYEDVLIPFFSKAGNIFEMRLMMEFSGLNRGFAYITYETPAMAKRAVSVLHSTCIPGTAHPICVYLSLDNCKLHVVGIPKHVGIREIREGLMKLLPGIVDVICSTEESSVFIEFESHRYAQEARKKMWPSKLELFGSQLSAEWAKPERTIVSKKQTTIFVSNLPVPLSKQFVLDFILKTVEDGSVVCIKKDEDAHFGYVEFSSVRYAENAILVLDGIKFKSCTLSARWARGHIIDAEEIYSTSYIKKYVTNNPTINRGLNNENSSTTLTKENGKQLLSKPRTIKSPGENQPMRQLWRQREMPPRFSRQLSQAVPPTPATSSVAMQKPPPEEAAQCSHVASVHHQEVDPAFRATQPGENQPMRQLWRQREMPPRFSRQLSQAVPPTPATSSVAMQKPPPEEAAQCSHVASVHHQEVDPAFRATQFQKFRDNIQIRRGPPPYMRACEDIEREIYAKLNYVFKK